MGDRIDDAGPAQADGLERPGVVLACPAVGTDNRIVHLICGRVYAYLF